MPETKSGGYRQNKMVKTVDITKTKAWPTLKELGFYKIKFTSQGVSYCYGAGQGKPGTKREFVTIEPFYRYHWSVKKQKNILRIEWRIHCSWLEDNISKFSTHSALSSKLLPTILEAMKSIKYN